MGMNARDAMRYVSIGSMCISLGYQASSSSKLSVKLIVLQLHERRRDRVELTGCLGHVLFFH